MGICASCLGLNRHPSQDNSETNPLLRGQQEQYGGVTDADPEQPDEEEVRREREELEQITTEATDNMIDVSHPGTSELSQHFAHAKTASREVIVEDDAEHTEEDEDEAAWLQSVQESDAGDVTVVKGLHSNDLVLDISQLRDETAGDSSAAKKSSKGVLSQ